LSLPSALAPLALPWPCRHVPAPTLLSNKPTIMKALKWIGIGIAGIVVLLGIVAGILYAMGGSTVNARVDLPDEALSVMADSAALAWGKQINKTHG